MNVYELLIFIAYIFKIRYNYIIDDLVEYFLDTSRVTIKG